MKKENYWMFVGSYVMALFNVEYAMVMLCFCVIYKLNYNTEWKVPYDSPYRPQIVKALLRIFHEN